MTPGLCATCHQALATPSRTLRWLVLSLLSLGSMPAATAADAAADARGIGLGKVFTAPHAGGLTTAPVPPEAKGRTAEQRLQAAPTNQWYSSVLFGTWSQVLHAHPATYRAGPDGFEIGYPHRVAAVAGRHGVDITYPHHPALTLRPTAFRPVDSRLAGHGDFSATIRLADAAGSALDATVVHGSPFSYYTLSRGDLQVQLAADARACAVGAGAEVLCVVADGRRFAVFAPPGTAWTERDTRHPTLHFASDARFVSVALLPDTGSDGDAAFTALLTSVQTHAYAFVTDSQVHWHYDAEQSRVDTDFVVTVQPQIAGATIPLLGLYPHQAQHLPPGQAIAADSPSYDSIRGPIRTVASSHFRVSYPWQGILPYWGPLQTDGDRERLAGVLGGDAARARNLFSQQIGHGTYWYGKALSAVAELMCVAEQADNTSLRDQELTTLRERFETWFRGDNASSYFVQNQGLGTVIGYPDEYGSVAHMNDHHFHYGYWIHAAAELALRDPAWAAPDHWGGMVNLLAADIATPERGRSDFPFVRNFDAYEGHSWASGDADSADGNNQESSSEAVNAWAGLILWGEATGNLPLRDLGIWLYTTETQAIATYWFDTEQRLFPPEYGGRPVAAQVFGGRYAYNTWWTEEPRQIQGINLIPITAASLYLGRDAAYVRRFAAALPQEVKAYQAKGGSDGTPDDIWQDIHASFLALADPAQALAQWRPRGTSELGETRSHTLFWLLSLQEMGTPDFSVHANTALYGVFRLGTGRRTYLAYNAGNAALDVRFSDGQTLTVAPHQLGRTTADPH